MSVDAFFTRLNPLITFVLRTPVLHWVLSPGVMLITVTGRRSGRRYTIPVGYQRAGNVVSVLVSEARRKSWWRNYLEPRAVELRLRGRMLRGQAEVASPETPEFRESAEQALARIPGLGRVFKIDYERRAGLSDAQVKQLGDEIAVVRIALDPDQVELLGA